MKNQLAVSTMWKQSPRALISLWDMIQLAGRQITDALERVLKMPSYRFSQATDHEANHANAQHRFTMIQSDFIVAAQSARFEEPAEGSFDNPAFGQNLESLGLIAAPHDVQFQFAIRAKLFDPSYQCPQVMDGIIKP